MTRFLGYKLEDASNFIRNTPVDYWEILTVGISVLYSKRTKIVKFLILGRFWFTPHRLANIQANAFSRFAQQNVRILFKS